MKIKSIFALTLIFIVVSNAFSKDYMNEQYGISFSLPDDWKVTDYEDLSPEIQQKLIRLYKQSQTLGVCGIKKPDKWNRTTMIIQYQDFKNVGFRDAMRELKSEHGKEMMITLAKLLALDTMGGRLRSYHIVESDSDFDKDRDMAFGKIYYQTRDKSDFVAKVSKLLVKDGIVTLQCFSLGTEVDTFEKTIGEIIDSFEFDPGAKSKGISGAIPQDINEVGNLPKEQTFNRIWKWVGIILTISIILGFVKMLLARR